MAVSGPRLRYSREDGIIPVGLAGRLYIDGLGTLGAFLDFELHFLPFGQCTETFPLYLREVNEDFIA